MLHQLVKPKEGAVKKKKPRLGRGQGSQRGGTCGKGTKGQQARSGYKRRPAFSSATPLFRALPKFGFRSPNRVVYAVMHTDLLQKIAEKYPGQTIDETFLFEKGYIKRSEPCKALLGKEAVTKKINIKLSSASKAAVQAIKAAGGNVTLNPR